MHEVFWLWTDTIVISDKHQRLRGPLEYYELTWDGRDDFSNLQAICFT